MVSIIASILVLLLVVMVGVLVWRSKLVEQEKATQLIIIIALLGLLVIVSDLKHFNYLNVSLFNMDDSDASKIFYRSHSISLNKPFVDLRLDYLYKDSIKQQFNGTLLKETNSKKYEMIVGRDEDGII